MEQDISNDLSGGLELIVIGFALLPWGFNFYRNVTSMLHMVKHRILYKISDITKVCIA
jgi:hypothetical protein